MVYCKDCAYFKERVHYERPICKHPESVISINPVYGNVTYKEAEDVRKDLKLCRREGRFFKKKEKVRLFDRLMGLFS